MAGVLNVNPDVTDQFYRYKMPRLIAKVGAKWLVSFVWDFEEELVQYHCGQVLPFSMRDMFRPDLTAMVQSTVALFQVEGKGNGIKTVIPNMVEIAKSLARPATCEYEYERAFCAWKYLFSDRRPKYSCTYSDSVYVSDPTKYFGCELGAQTQFDYKNERYIVNGAHDSAKLQDLLGNFIRKFVLCPECDNPETHLVSACMMWWYALCKCAWNLLVAFSMFETVHFLSSSCM